MPSVSKTSPAIKAILQVFEALCADEGWETVGSSAAGDGSIRVEFNDVENTMDLDGIAGFSAVYSVTDQVGEECQWLKTAIGHFDGGVLGVVTLYSGWDIDNTHRGTLELRLTQVPVSFVEEAVSARITQEVEQRVTKLLACGNGAARAGVLKAMHQVAA